MKTHIEKPKESLDFGDLPTIVISAFTARDIFRLGVILAECIDAEVDVVHSETTDKRGMFLRLPLSHVSTKKDS